MPIEMTEDVKPEDVGLLFEEPVIGLDEMDEGQLDGARVQRYHGEQVLRLRLGMSLCGGTHRLYIPKVNKREDSLLL